MTTNNMSGEAWQRRREHRRPHPATSTTNYFHGGNNSPAGYLQSGDNLSGPAADALRRRVQLELLRHAGTPITGEMRTAAAHFGVRRPIKLTSDCRLAAASGLLGLGVEEPLSITGKVIPYGTVSKDMGGYRLVFAPGCFAVSLVRDNVAMLHQHDTAHVLGRKSSGTALFYETPTGLHVECTPPDSTYGTDLMVSLDRGDIDQLSASFAIIKDHWDRNQIRVVDQAQLFEVSVVSWSELYEAPVAAGQVAAGSPYLKSMATGVTQ